MNEANGKKFMIGFRLYKRKGRVNGESVFGDFIDIKAFTVLNQSAFPGFWPA